MTKTIFLFAVLEVLCERGDGNAYLAIWKDQSTATFEVQTSGGLDLGETSVSAGHRLMKIMSRYLHDPIIIPQGRSRVEIGGSEFHCDY